MIHVSKHALSIMVLYAVLLHLSWAIILVFDDAAVNATALNALARHVGPPYTLAAVIAGAALSALLAMMTYSPWTLLLLLPQQLLLMASAGGAVEAIWAAQFADGVARPRAFIAADQLYSILAAICHTVAIIMHALHSHGRPS